MLRTRLINSALMPPLVLALALLACAPKPEHLVHVMALAAPGVKVGGRVQYSGADAGLVRAIYDTPSGVRIDIEMTSPEMKVRKADMVRIVSVGGFGEQVVQIEPGPATAAPLPAGGTLTATPAAPATR